MFEKNKKHKMAPYSLSSVIQISRNTEITNWCENMLLTSLLIQNNHPSCYAKRAIMHPSKVGAWVYIKGVNNILGTWILAEELYGPILCGVFCLFVCFFHILQQVPINSSCLGECCNYVLLSRNVQCGNYCSQATFVKVHYSMQTSLYPASPLMA